MQRIKKLKPDRNVKGFIPALFSLIAGACALSLGGYGINKKGVEL